MDRSSTIHPDQELQLCLGYAHPRNKRQKLFIHRTTCTSATSSGCTHTLVWVQLPNEAFWMTDNLTSSPAFFPVSKRSIARWVIPAHSHHLSFCREVYKWTGGLCTPGSSEGDSAVLGLVVICGTLTQYWITRLQLFMLTLLIKPLNHGYLLLWDLPSVFTLQHKSAGGLCTFSPSARNPVLQVTITTPIC